MKEITIEMQLTRAGRRWFAALLRRPPLPVKANKRRYGR